VKDEGLAIKQAMHGTARSGLRTAVLSALLAIALDTAFPAAARSELVDHIAAAVNNEVITSSELAQAVALNERLGSGGAAVVAETFEGLIRRRLLVQEARRLRFVDVTDQEVAAEVEKMQKRFPSNAAFDDFLKTADMTRAELNRMLGEQLLVERFVEKKVGLFVRVNRDEAQAYFDTHAAEFKGKRFQDVQKAITAALTDRKINEQLDRYVADLRAKAEIRINQ
jgi:hypothetical protein